jgi:hypothetical protein
MRVIANIGLRRLKCHRRVLLARDVFGRRVKKSVSKADQLTSFATRKNTLRWFVQ